MNENTAERIPADRRREQILAAAAVVFGERGYAGTTTDQVAQAAGISQPYVVRMFGSKERLFLAVLDRALKALLAAFRSALAEAGDDRSPAALDALAHRFGAVYTELVRDGGIALPLMQGFVAGHEPAIGAAARDGFLELYALLRDEAGFDAERSRSFLADGMLINTLIAIRMPDAAGDVPAAQELLRSCFGSELPAIMPQGRV